MENRSHFRLEFYEGLRRAQAHQAVRIRQSADQVWNRSGFREFAQAYDRAQPHKPYGISHQLAENVEGQATFRVRHRPGRRGAQFIEFISHELQQVHAERRSGHFAQNAAKHFTQWSFRMLHIGNQQLRALRAALDECVLQRHRRHRQSSLAHPSKDLLRRLRSGRPPQASQRRQSYFRIAVTQSIRHR